MVKLPLALLESHVPTGGCVAFEELRLRTYDMGVSDEGKMPVVI